MKDHHQEKIEELEQIEEDSPFTAEYCIKHGALEDLRRTREYKHASTTLQVEMELEGAEVRLQHEIDTYNEHIKAFRNDDAREQLNVIKFVRAGISALHEKRTKQNSQRVDDFEKNR